MARGIKLRNWSIDSRDYESEDDFRAAVAQELALFEHIGERFGIGFVAAPVRQQLASGAYVTVAWTFQPATIPAAREAAKAESAPEVPEADGDGENAVDEPEGDLVAVAAGVVAEDPYAEG